jgi:hypothetical protein
MAKQSSAATDAQEAQASQAATRAVAATVGRPLGLILGVLGFGLGLGAFGGGDFTAAVGWLSLGGLGFAMAAVGRDSAQPAD